MKKIITIAIVGLMFSCETTDSELKIKNNYNSFQDVANDIPVNSNGQVKVVLIDSCEYIVWAGSHGEVGFCHKGNCKNH